MNVRDLLTRWRFQTDGEPLKKLGEQIEHIKSSLEFLGAVEIAKGIQELTERFVKFGQELRLNAQGAGMTVEQFQELSFAAKQAVVAPEELAMVMRTLSRNLVEARQGMQEPLRAFAQLGISPEQIASYKTTGQALLGISDKLKAMKDPVMSAGLASEVLGRANLQMIGFLKQGSAEIRRQGVELDRIGAVLSGPQVEALRRVEESLIKFAAVIENIGATIAVYLSPIVNAAVKEFTDFYAANKRIIELNIKEWADEVAYALGFIHGLVQTLVEVFLKFALTHQTLVRRVAELFSALLLFNFGMVALSRIVQFLMWQFGVFGKVLGLIKFAMYALSGGAARDLMLKFATMTETLLPAVSEAFLAMGAAIEATPIGWIVTGIAGLVVVVHDLWKLLTGGSFKDTWIGEMFGALGSGLNALGIPTVSGAVGESPTAPKAKGGGFFAALSGMGSALADVGGPPPVSGAAVAAGAGGGTSHYSVNAPITVAIPPGVDGRAVARAAQEGVKEHLDRVHREAARSLRSPLVR